ncbi:MAG: ABC transporter substrate-binding protein [Proteobacteria bacterium]|nr:ABC transporter substrate-binding protein [Pseudomonadota bacterium]MBI3495730.1 ABC transporter substrate-binding protein [Pseudomonadota bacterium]
MHRVLMLAACASLALAGTALAQSTLRIGLAEDPDILDPSIARTYVGRIVFAGLCDKLVDIDKDLKLVPQLATEWSWSADQRQLTFKLRPGVTFHDGERFDADAVKYNIERHLSLPESRRKTEISQVQSVDMPDPMTVRLNLEVPFAPLIAQLTDRAGMMLSPKAAKAMGAQFGTNPVCSGPYKFAERVQQDRIVLDRFKEHWNKDAYHFDRVTYLPIVDNTVRLANLQSGQIDLAERLAATDIEAIKKGDKLTVNSVVSLGYRDILINVANGERAKTPLGQDKRVRQALELSIDRDAINQVVFNGNFRPGNQWVSPSSPWYARGTPIPKRDLARAKALLKEAGHSSLSFTMMVPNNNETLQVAQVIQAMAGEAGFEVKLLAMEFATSLEQSAKGNFEAYLIGWSGRADPDGNLHAFVSCAGAQNDGRYCDKEMDALLDKTRATNDIEQRMLVYDQVAKKLQVDRPLIYIYHDTLFWVANKRLTGFNAVPDGMARLAGLKFE